MIMGDIYIMSSNELKRKVIFEAVKEKKLKLSDAALKIPLSVRQTSRCYNRYLKEGDAGLIHKSRGKKPSNAKAGVFKKKILDLYQAKYMGFGPTLASEKLLEDDGLCIHSETLRLWLLQANLFTKQRKRKRYRKQRERKIKFGEMLQIDGSIHDWFDDGRKNHCLLNMVDDATNTTLAILDTGETTHVLLSALKQWIESYGVPNSVYVDLKSVYVSPVGLRTVNADDKVNFSVFETVCEKLGITIIKAYSAQAKGRVERSHRIFQDRFIKELKLYNIKTIDDANKYLKDTFLPKLNQKFAYEIEEDKNAHRDAKIYGDLDEILCWEYTRTLKNNWTIQLNNEHFQIDADMASSVQPQDRIIIKKHLSGVIKIWFDGKELSYKKLEAKKEPASKGKKYYINKGRDFFKDSLRARKNKHKSPWGKFTPGWLSGKKNKLSPPQNQQVRE